jgi:import inner membrane translocase subunit TIM8
MSPTLNEEQQAKLQEFLEIEQQKAKFQSVVHSFTELCWDKCIGKPGTALSSSENSCLAYCVERFLDTSLTIVNRLEDMRKKI